MSDTHSNGRDHGGGLDGAVARWGGVRGDWLDLSTGINPVPYPLPALRAEDWTALPDAGALQALEDAARAFWQVPDGAMVVAAPGASALIARMPELFGVLSVDIPGPTYNEHAAAFRAAGCDVVPDGDGRVLVHPNNPDGRMWGDDDLGRAFTVIDESFCDVMPEASRIHLADRPDVVILKSFGKFWGLAGARLGFAIGHPETLAPMVDMLGPWAVAGPTLRIGAEALRDDAWAAATRARLATDAARMDALIKAPVAGGTTLFRTYEVEDARAAQAKLAQGRVWSRVFPYSDRWLRLGLPGPDGWDQLEAAWR